MSKQPPQPVSRRDRREAARFDRPARSRARVRDRAGTPAWRSPVVVVTAAALVVGAVLIALALPKAPATTDELQIPPLSYPTELIDGDAIGSDTAPVVIDLYADFQCPACKLFVTTQLHRLIDDFVVPGVVRIQAQDVAFLGRGQPDESLELAAGGACAADQDRYWQFHDLVFWNQGRENQGDHDMAFIERVADAAGVNRAQWADCLADSATRVPITSRTQAALGKGIQSTPTLLVNGQAVVGVPSYDQLAAMIRTMASQAPSSTT